MPGERVSKEELGDEIGEIIKSRSWKAFASHTKKFGPYEGFKKGKWRGRICHKLLTWEFTFYLIYWEEEECGIWTKVQSHVSQASVPFIVEESPLNFIMRQLPRLYFFQVIKTCTQGREGIFASHICKKRRTEYSNAQKACLNTSLCKTWQKGVII